MKATLFSNLNLSFLKTDFVDYEQDEPEFNMAPVELQFQECQVKTINPLLLIGTRNRSPLNDASVLVSETNPEKPPTKSRNKRGRQDGKTVGKSKLRIWIDHRDQSFLKELSFDDDEIRAAENAEGAGDDSRSSRRIDRYIKAGTVRGLTMCLVELYWTDWEFVHSYLAAFREFQSPEELFKILRSRFEREARFLQQ